MTIICKHCGEKFTPTKEEIALHNDGFCPLPDTCEECFDMQENSQYPEDTFDSDSGL